MKSRFFNLEPEKYCKHPEHEFPKHFCIPFGKGYIHVCPGCGNSQIVMAPQIEF